MGAKVSGEVEFMECGTASPPERILTNAKDLSSIQTLKLRVREPTGTMVQVLWRGDFPGHLDLGDQIQAEGLLQGGVLRAEKIYNETTASWVTPRACFIATAAAGGESPEVRRLRQLRDEVLLHNIVGRHLIDIYERFSPPLAGFISSRDGLRFVTRWVVVKPASVIAHRVLS